MSGRWCRASLLVVCDSWGVGDAPDAAAYGDGGADTLGNTSRAVGGLHAPNLEALGLGHLTPIEGVGARAEPGAAHGRATERSAGKDTTTGHWEMMGIRLDEPFPLYPNGFPPEIVEPFEEAIGREILGNVPASGTEIIAELGEEHIRTGSPIVYTSGDSVFQIATPQGRRAAPDAVRVVPRRAAAADRRAHGRQGDRPAVRGAAGAFVRSPERRDFAVPPPGPTVLDRLQAAGVPVYGGRQDPRHLLGQGHHRGPVLGFERPRHGADAGLPASGRRPAFVFTNLVDFDSKYGHRNDPAGYAKAIEAFDGGCPRSDRRAGRRRPVHHRRPRLRPDDASTDHTRERTPLLAAGLPGGPHEIGTRESFGDLGQTIAALLGVEVEGLDGASFADRIGFGGMIELERRRGSR